ncbi:MAG: hypothetical protein GXO39_01205 [Thermotogae bacterium]|nr:hypothetical protein [Thermotogota bacterium]
MFVLYPYFSSYHVIDEGLSAHLQMDLRMVFWSVSVPSYDRYGFAGYQQTDFGEQYNLNLGNSFVAFSTGRFALSLFYTNAISGQVTVDTFSYTYDFKGGGVSLAFSPLKWAAFGIDAFISSKDRGGGFDFTLRYEYLGYISGGLYYTSQSKDIIWDVATFLALPDPRMSSIGLYASNRYATSFLLRYETNITRNRRIKLGGGFIYDSTYAPVLSVGNKEKFGRYDMGIDILFFPVRHDYDNLRIEWNDVTLSLWIGF